MRYLLFIAIIFIFPSSSRGQSIDKLDKANGFKEFKFGKTKERWDGELKALKNGAYRYTGKNALAAFGSSIHKIYLKFDTAGQLSGVYISIQGLIGKSGVKNYKRIISLAYGKENKEEEKDDALTYYWHASKVNLVLYSWAAGSTWDAELHFTNPEQYAADNKQAAGKE